MAYQIIAMVMLNRGEKLGTGLKRCDHCENSDLTHIQPAKSTNRNEGG